MRPFRLALCSALLSCGSLWASAGSLLAQTFAPEPANGIPTLEARYPADGAKAAALGSVEVLDAGTVKLTASREQMRIVINAIAQDGGQIGRAESVVGLGDTPIYVRSARGLHKIMIHWKS